MQHAAKTMCGGFRFHKYEESIMNTNIDYLGLLALHSFLISRRFCHNYMLYSIPTVYHLRQSAYMITVCM